MAFSITFKDETMTGRLIQEISVPAASETLTLREIIMMRVEEEIKRREDEKHERFTALALELDEKERVLNGVRERRNKTGDIPDPESHGYRALRAFQQNAYFVLVDDVQTDDLETTIGVTEKTTVTFVKTTPLVGG
jgi:hypothetical protein